jgi:hypothetical protein
MTHRHEWEYDIRYKPGVVECKFVCVECDEEMNGEEVLRRLNATEDLSAERIDMICEQLLTGPILVQNDLEALRNYAKILRGE